MIKKLVIATFILSIFVIANCDISLPDSETFFRMRDRREGMARRESTQRQHIPKSERKEQLRHDFNDPHKALQTEPNEKEHVAEDDANQIKERNKVNHFKSQDDQIKKEDQAHPSRKKQIKENSQTVSQLHSKIQDKLKELHKTGQREESNMNQVHKDHLNHMGITPTNQDIQKFDEKKGLIQPDLSHKVSKKNIEDYMNQVKKNLHGSHQIVKNLAEKAVGEKKAKAENLPQQVKSVEKSKDFKQFKAVQDNSDLDNLRKKLKNGLESNSGSRKQLLQEVQRYKKDRKNLFGMLKSLNIRFKHVKGSEKLMPYFSKKLNLPEAEKEKDLSWMKGFLSRAQQLNKIRESDCKKYNEVSSIISFVYSPCIKDFDPVKWVCDPIKSAVDYGVEKVTDKLGLNPCDKDDDDDDKDDDDDNYDDDDDDFDVQQGIDDLEDGGEDLGDVADDAGDALADGVGGTIADTAADTAVDVATDAGADAIADAGAGVLADAGADVVAGGLLDSAADLLPLLLLC